ncbi:MAG: serine/threonine protein kinase [Pirellulaceae bacterium]|jgi:serine/threonine protein kinase
MSELTAERLGQRILDLGVLEPSEIESAWTELGTREVSPEDFLNHLVRKEMLTNYQVDRLVRGERVGYFYGKYKVLYFIGSGTFARVYRAVHNETGRVIAIKVLRKRFRDELGQVEQFLREGQMGVQLRHPNIVSIYEVASDRLGPYMVMDFVEGRTLREFVRIRKKLDPITSLQLIMDVVAGLAHASEKGITHRDLKMSNVLITSDGKAKLVDFGLAAARGESDEELADSPSARAIDYAALERGTNVRKDDSRSDIYFVGCIFYNMLVGTPPLFETRDRLKRLSVSRFYDVKPIIEAAPDLPHYIISIVSKAMELDPEKRYQSPQEMLAELKLAAHRLKDGDTGVVESAAEDGIAKQTTKSLKAALEGADRTVMVIESNTVMQDILRDKLKRRGYRVLVISSPERALARFDHEQVADVVIFCATELGGTALDAFNQFATNKETQNIPAILIADKRQQYIFKDAELADHRVIMSMPLQVRDLRGMLAKLLKPA